MNDREQELLRDMRNEMKLLRGKQERFEKRITELERRCDRSEGLLGELPTYVIDTLSLENTDEAI